MHFSNGFRVRKAAQSVRKPQVNRSTSTRDCHTIPVQDYKAGKLTIYSITNFYPTSCLGRPFLL